MFRFDLEIPFVRIEARVMYQDQTRIMTTQYIAWYIRIWKWRWMLEWGKDRWDR